MAYPRRPRANPNWNAYRPDYSDNHQEAPVRRDYTYDRPSPPARLPPASTVMPAPYAYDDNDPNSIPVQPRRRVQQASPTPIRGTPDLSQDDGPQLWPAELDVMIGQVTRAYDVVINYERDCPNGKRWTTKGIRRVHEAGAYLHADVGVLRGWKRQAQELGTADEFMKRKIDEDWARVEKTCKKVRAAIDDEEKKARVIDGGYENGEIDYSKQTERKTDRSRSRSPREQEDALRGRGRQRAERRRRWGGAVCWRLGPDRPGVAGRLGKHVLHY